MWIDSKFCHLANHRCVQGGGYKCSCKGVAAGSRAAVLVPALWPPVGAPRHHHLQWVPGPFLTHFSVGIFHLDQGQRIINRTEKQQTAMWPPKGTGREREWGDPSSWEWWPFRSARTSFQENIWRQNLLVKALLTISVVSQFISFKAWKQIISHFFAGSCLAIALTALLPYSLCIQKQTLFSVDLLLFVLTNLY